MLTQTHFSMNSSMIQSFDAGGTYLKYGSPTDPHLLPLPYTKELIFDLITNETDKIILTGAGSNSIATWIKTNNNLVKKDQRLEIKIYNEFLATGLGGAKLANKKECLVVNIGSGTPVLYVNAENHTVNHIGGSGLGSASLVGLSHFILNISDLHKIAEFASMGDPNKVNLLVSDLYDRSTEDLGLPGDITASNFGKYQDWRVVTNKPDKNDILAGLHVLVAETISVIATQASRSYRPDIPIVLTGGGTMNAALVKYLKKTFTYLNKEVIIPENAIYGTLNGLYVIDSFQ